MLYDNRDYNILNNYEDKDLLYLINYLKINIKNKNISRDRMIKNILKYYFIDNNDNKLKKKYKGYNNIAYRFNLLKLAYIAGNDNNDNIKEINKISHII